MTNYLYPCSLLLFVTTVAAIKVQISPCEMSRTSSNVTGAAAPYDDQNNNAAVDRLRDRMIRLTKDRSNAVAALIIAQEREYMLALLEREKYKYLHATTDKMRRLVYSMQQSDAGVAADTYQERCDQKQTATITTRTLSRSGSRLQALRRLLAAAEVGLMHIIESRDQPGTATPGVHK